MHHGVKFHHHSTVPFSHKINGTQSKKKTATSKKGNPYIYIHTISYLVEHHLADDGMGLSLFHVEHLAQRRQAERLVVRGVREQVRSERFRLFVRSCGP